jgi:hypothetical protein|tara:strand:+ start:255 stop:485 length:231 start_codon:yes stop_codon:yes gene_type:complete
MIIEIKAKNKHIPLDSLGNLNRTKNLIRKNEAKQKIDNTYSNTFDKAIEMKAKRNNDRKQKRENAYQMRASKRGLI